MRCTGRWHALYLQALIRATTLDSVTLEPEVLSYYFEVGNHSCRTRFPAQRHSS